MPCTTHGKAVAARNATTHGLFARDIVLPTLGEDPHGYRQVQDELAAQLQPQNLLERHYIEKIAAASWRLRRLHRWQAQIFEDPALTEDQRLDKLDKILRHENYLHRQIDSAVKMLRKEVPQLHESRARRQALLDTMQTELDCRENRENELEVTFEARTLLQKTTAEPHFDYARLDALPTSSPDSPRPLDGEGLPTEAETREAENRQNEQSPQMEPAEGQTWAELLATIKVVGDKARWRWVQEKCERERLLSLLTQDVNDVHPDGRPIYVDEAIWADILYQRAEGNDTYAAKYDARERARFFEDLETARELLADMNASDSTPLPPAGDRSGEEAHGFTGTEPPFSGILTLS